MSLKDFTPKTETITIPSGGEFAVRGLSLDDITSLVQLHYGPLAALFDKYIAEGVANAVTDSASDENVTAVVMDLARQAPRLIADVICHAADERDAQASVSLLPIGVQVATIEAVLRLTLEAEGGLEKLAATVMRLGSNLTEAVAARAA